MCRARAAERDSGLFGRISLARVRAKSRRDWWAGERGERRWGGGVMSWEEGEGEGGAGWWLVGLRGRAGEGCGGTFCEEVGVG